MGALVRWSDPAPAAFEIWCQVSFETLQQPNIQYNVTAAIEVGEEWFRYESDAQGNLIQV